MFGVAFCCGLISRKFTGIMRFTYSSNLLGFFGFLNLRHLHSISDVLFTSSRSPTTILTTSGRIISGPVADLCVVLACGCLPCVVTVL